MFAANAYRIHPAGKDDEATLHFLAALDDQSPLSGTALIGEIDGLPAAAISVADGRVIADPLLHTDHLAACLRVRAQAHRAAEATPSLRQRLLAPVLTTTCTSRATNRDKPGLQPAPPLRASAPPVAVRNNLGWKRTAQAAVKHGYELDPDTGKVRKSISRRDRLNMIAQREEIHQLPETSFEPFVPDWQIIDWSADRPDISQAAADGYAHDLQTIRDLPDVSR
jgi:hypothetical protein